MYLKIAWGSLIRLALLMLVLTAGGCAFQKDQRHPYITYRDKEYGFQFQYPQHWEVKKGESGLVVGFLSPTQSDDDNFRENVNLVIPDVSIPISFEQFVQGNIQHLQEIVTRFRLLSSREVTLGPYQAHEIVYTGEEGQLKLKSLQVSILVDQKAYILTFIAEQDQFDAFESQARRIMGTFRIQ